MSGLTEEDLRRSTLARQFPAVRGVDEAAVLELVDRLGPIQSQVPRAPFLTIASRLPGASYATICRLFETYRLVKAKNLRGTIHTSTRRNFADVDAVATQTGSAALRNALKLQTVTAADVDSEVRRYCDGEWRLRSSVSDHMRTWLAEHESADSAAALDTTYGDSIVWGNSGLLRRPADQAWEKRTDVYHRTACSLGPDLAAGRSPADALGRLVRTQLGAYGPLTRRDLAFFFGCGLAQVDAALAGLGEVVLRLPGPGREPYLDLAEPPTGGADDPGLRLLAEFDGLLLGFEGHNRTRFVDADGLGRIWAKVNGLFTPVVLHDGRLVACWRTKTKGTRTDLEVTMLAPGRLLPADLFVGPVAALEQALPVSVTEVRVLPPAG